MKRFIVYILSSTVLFFAACTEDKGNYDYVDPSEIINITISNISDEGYEVVLGERLIISPEITGFIPGKKYEYEWYILGENSNTRRTIANTLELDEEIVAVSTENYFLYLQITDVETGVYVDYGTTLRVSASLLTSGWYVLKELDGVTEVDYCKYSTAEVWPDILSRLSSSNYQLNGSPVSIAYQASGFNFAQIQEDGTTKIISKKALHVVTTEDMASYDAEELILYSTLDEQFYKAPDTWNPQFLYNSGGLFLVNDGELFTTSTAITGLSRFSSAKIRSGAIFPSLIASGSYTCYGFDMATRSFMYSANYNNNAINYFNTKTTGGVTYSSSNMEYDMIAIPTNSYIRLGNNRCYVMRSTVDGKYYTVSVALGNTLSTAYPLNTIKEVPASSLMPTAKAFTSIYGIVFCFGVGNTLYYYDHEAVGGVNEFVLNEYPADEEILHLDFNYYTNFQYISVLTWNSTNNTWKLYIHNMTSNTTISGFTKEPKNVFTGEGKPVMNICRQI